MCIGATGTWRQMYSHLEHVLQLIIKKDPKRVDDVNHLLTSFGLHADPELRLDLARCMISAAGTKRKIEDTEELTPAQVSLLTGLIHSTMQRGFALNRLRLTDSGELIGQRWVVSGKFSEMPAKAYCLPVQRLNDLTSSTGSLGPDITLLKTLSSPMLTDETADQSFSEGADHVIRLVACMEDSARFPYYVITTVEECRPLEVYLRDLLNTNRSNCNFLQQISAQVLKAVLFCHTRLVLLRDISTAAFVVSGDRTDNIHVRMLHFGLAKLCSSGEELSMTGDAAELVPLLWLPLVCLQQLRYDTASEAYTVAMCIYQIFSFGIHPFLELKSTNLAVQDRVVTVCIIIVSFTQSLQVYHWLFC